MKQLTFRLIIASVTLTIGIGIVTILFFRQPLPKVALPQYPPGCASESDAEIIIDSAKDWRKEFLARFRELPLEKLSSNADETYRMLWIPTFDSPTVIRVWRSGDNYYIVIKRLDRNQNDLTIGGLIFEQTHSLTAEEWNNFVNLVNHGCFWKVPSNINEHPVPDGASWMFEGFSEGEYHFVDRTLPSDYMIEIYKNLFKLTKIEMEYESYL